MMIRSNLWLLIGLILSLMLSACQGQAQYNASQETNELPITMNSIELEEPKDFEIDIGTQTFEPSIGNTTGNISNSASVAYYDGWVYVAFGSIFKMRPDGSERTIISDMKGSHINVTDQGIFFLDRTGGYRGSTFYIYRMNHDGTNIQQLNHHFSFDLTVINDWIYYTADPYGTTGPDHLIYRMKTDGSNQEQLSDEYAMDMIVVDDWIYYANFAKGHIIWKMRLDGSDKQVFFGTAMRLSARSILYSDNWIYCINRNDGILYRISLDGEDLELVITHHDRKSTISSYNIQGQWIYYTVFGDKLFDDGPATYAYRIDSKETRFVREPSDALHYNLYRIEKMEERILCHHRGEALNIAGGYLFYGGFHIARERELYSVPLKGGKEKHIDSDHS